MGKARIQLATTARPASAPQGGSIFERVCEALEQSAAGIALEIMQDPDARTNTKRTLTPPNGGSHGYAFDPRAPLVLTIDVRMERAEPSCLLPFPHSHEPER